MRPHVIASAATSLDGYLDDTSPHRLVLSNDEDLDRVDEVRADVDAILVGAGTVRADDPRLRVRAEWRRAQRVHAGQPENPLRVVLSASGELDPGARVFDGDPPLVYTTTESLPRAKERLGEVATVADAGTEPTAAGVLDDLAARGVRRLLVEGGAAVHTLFLAAGLVDELHLVLAPFFLGTRGDPRFVHPAALPTRAWRLADTRVMADVVLLRYFATRARSTGADRDG